MKIAVIGSREGFEQKDINYHLITPFYAMDATLITGGARGVDKFAEIWAKSNGVSLKIIRPKDPTKKQDYILRNFKIVNEADKIIAFWDGISKGTKSVIDYAKKKNKVIKVIRK